MIEEKLNCWEFMKCGRGPGELNSKRNGVCKAAKEQRLHFVHGGKNAGRACWVVAGTFCGGSVQGTFAKKMLACKRCDFYVKVQQEEGGRVESAQSMLAQLKDYSRRLDITTRKLGLLIGGSGLIGGALTHYFKTKTSDEIEVLSPNSKKLSLRDPRDITGYFDRYQPDFVVNSAISSIDSDAQLSYEINYLGAVRIAKMAIAHKIPYIHFSSAATQPMVKNITEETLLELDPKLPNYTKSKLMAEKTLQHMHETQGLDYTTIRLAVVYGKHDHKIQGFHRMLFSIADQSMPFILSKPGVCHSYSYTKKVPFFVNHILENRAEFSGQTYNFVDRDPVELIGLIKAIKKYMNVNAPREICIPYSLASMNKTFLKIFAKILGKVGVEILMPAELLFMKSFYESQSLSSEKLEKSSYKDPFPDVTVYSKLPTMIDYYITRWKHLNRISTYDKDFQDPSKTAWKFNNSPQTLLETINRNSHLPLDELENRL